jgi:hypothetical protein
MRNGSRTAKDDQILVERSDVWINLHHMFSSSETHSSDECVGGLNEIFLPVPNPPDGSCLCLPRSDRIFAFVSLYLCPGINGEQAIPPCAVRR